MQERTLRSLDRPSRDTRPAGVTSCAGDGITQAVVASGALLPFLEFDSAMLVERGVTDGTGERRLLYVRSVGERPSIPRSALSFDTEVTAEAHIFSHRGPYVHRRHCEFESARGDRLLAKIQRCAEKLVGKHDVVSAPSDAYELDVFLRQPEQTVGLRSTFQRPGSRRGLRLSNHLLDPCEPILHFRLPRREDVGVFDSVAGHAGGFAGLLNLFVSLHITGEAMTAPARDPGEEHGARRVLGSVTSNTAVEPALRFVRSLMTGPAIELERLAEFHEPVLDRQVALRAFDVVLAEVNPVHQCGILILIESLGFVVAPVAPGHIGTPVACRHLFVA